jgi:hypothetical protein
VLRLGGGEEPLYGVVSAFAVPPDVGGSIAVIDGASASLRLFDASGRELRRLGGPGDGPGEFRDLTAAGVLPPDSLWAYDFLAARITVFGPMGAVRTLRVEGAVPYGTALGLLGRALLLAESPVILPGSSEGLRRDSLRLVLFHLDQADLRPFGTFSGRETLVEIDATEQAARVVKTQMPFSYETRHAVLATSAAGEGRVVTGENERYELVWRDAATAVRRILRAEVEGLPVDEALWRDYAEVLAVEIGAPERAARLQRRIEQMPLHERGPAFTWLIGGGAPGRPTELWVGLPPAPRDSLAAWVRHDAAGAPVESVVLPADFRLTDVSPERFIGVHSDELGVERVELYAR